MDGWTTKSESRLCYLKSPHLYTVKSVLSDHSKIDKIKILMTNGSLIKVQSIALQYF